MARFAVLANILTLFYNIDVHLAMIDTAGKPRVNLMILMKLL